MPLCQYAVERYRCFVEPVTINVRPLTLFFGRNSSGKSALARALPLLAHSAASDGATPLALDCDAARGAVYSDIASRLSDRNAMTLSLAWEGVERSASRIAFQFRDMGNRHIVEDLVADIAGKEVRLRYEPGGPLDVYRFAVGTRPWRSQGVPVTFMGLRPYATGRGTQLASALSDVRRSLEAFATSVYWLGAVRQPIERRIDPQSPSRLGPRGEGVGHLLADDSKGQRQILGAINPRYRAMFGYEVRVDFFAEGAAVVLTPTEGPPIPIALADAGEGASQALPVFVLGALAQVGRLGLAPTIVLEQPEIHLHPGAERELADFICAVARTSDARFVIETHSENLLLFIQLAVARGDLKASDLSIYFVRSLDRGQGSRADAIHLDDLGRPDGWPPGVFSEDVTLARQIILAQRRRTGAQ